MAVRTGGTGLKDGAGAVLTPRADYAVKSAAPRRTAGAPRLRRDPDEDFSRREAEAEEEYVPRRRFGGLRFRLRGGVPRTLVGKFVAGGTFLGVVAVLVGVGWTARSMLMHDPRLMIASSSSIQTVGNAHLTRAQLLTVFGEDVDRNLLAMPLAERRRELESLPWVEHATVMRLLPNKVRVAITERVPVAFVRQGSHIGLVDANGVLLEMSPEVTADQHYSFPVVTGVTADEPESTRNARMKLFAKFAQDLDAGGQQISKKLSEVDLSSPEDVMALIPSGGSDILVHFGDTDFLARYERFERNIGDWKRAHAELGAVDMRYEREAVLEMKPGKPVAAALVAPTAAPVVALTNARKPVVAAKKPAVAVKKPAVVKPVAKLIAKPVAKGPAAPEGGHLQTAFDAKHSKGPR